MELEMNRRVLIVDDNREIHRDFHRILCADPDTHELKELAGNIFGGHESPQNGSSYFLDSAYQGEEALRLVQNSIAENKPYALAFVDVRMPPGFDGIETILTGIPFIFNEMMDLLGSSMRNMLLLSIGIMLLVLALIFSVRGFFAWRWLPLGAVLIAIVYAFGVMGIIPVPITMVTMAAFPILIGLGVDYAIQFHNRYDEESRRGETVAEAIKDAVTHIGPTIGIAIIAACL